MQVVLLAVQLGVCLASFLLLSSLVAGPIGALRRPPATHTDRHGDVYFVHSLEKKSKQIDSQ
jgi:hypothetical protein